MLIKFSRVAMAVLILGFAGVGRAMADPIIMNPAGLSAGDTFRIVFVTDAKMDATSGNISDYNTFVNTDATAQAGGGSFTYNGTALTFSAIASTLTTNAIANIGENASLSGIFLASGTEVTSADDSTGLWSGSLMNPINQDLLGSQPSGSGAWTGTSPTGATANALGGNGTGIA